MQRVLLQGGNHLHVLRFRRLHEYTRNSSVHHVLTLRLHSRLASTAAWLMFFSDQFIYVAVFFFFYVFSTRLTDLPCVQYVSYQLPVSGPWHPGTGLSRPVTDANTDYINDAASLYAPIIY